MNLSHAGSSEEAVSTEKLVWFQPGLWIDGNWWKGNKQATFAVSDPATGEVIENLPLGGEREARQAVEAASAAFPVWKNRTPQERADILCQMHDLLLRYREPLARLRTAEQGAPLAQARGEVAYSAAFFRWYAEEARRICGRTIPHPDPRRRLRLEYYPVGVVGAITPWNAPLAQPAKKVSAALAAGCTVVLKPSELTPLSALALAWISEQAQLPAGVFNVVCGDAVAIGRVLLEHPAVRAISFTGSTLTGKYLMSEAGKQIKRVALELGGNAPYVIFADANLDQAVDDLIGLKCVNSGQVCVTANRILVEKSVHQVFLKKLLEQIAGERVGDGRDPASTMGPLIHSAAAKRVRSLTDEAVSSGARVLFRGQAPEHPAFYPPTVLDGVTPEMRITREEIFGPVFSIMTFDSEEEALEQANDTPYGLASFVYTNNMARAQRFADGLETGVVGINDPRPIIPEAPFGGVKQSGIGREGGTEGLLEYMDSRLIGIRHPAQ